MRDDVLLNKAAAIERCVARAREEYNIDPVSFATNFSRQDAAILNIQRACEAALDIGQHLIRREQLGVPQSARDVFELLAKSKWIESWHFRDWVTKYEITLRLIINALGGIQLINYEWGGMRLCF